MLLSALALLLLLSAPTAYADKTSVTPDPAQAELQAAEALAAQGRYEQAVAAYRKLAKAQPDTEAGLVARLRTGPTAYVGQAPILRHGPSDNRIDVVILGDGYRLKEQKKFDKTAAVVPTLFKRHHVLGEYFRYHNFHRVNLISKDTHPDQNGREYDTALDAKASGGLQGQVKVDRDLVTSFVEQVPDQDGLAIVFVQRGKLGTGGSGLATIGGRADTTLIHEWGHAFGALADEYATTTGHRAGHRDAPNVSETDNPARVPWKHWLEAKVRGVGIYEGAMGQVRGAWRPTNRCAMEDGTAFCVVCREALVLEIYRRVDPIESCTPAEHERDEDTPLEATQTLEFAVTVMEPTKHALTATWWVLAESDVPEAPTSLFLDDAENDRRIRGPLCAIERRPAQTSKKAKKGVHVFDLDASKLAPGRYRVICRVTDPVQARGDKTPWVLSDPHGLLHSERAWWVVVR